MRFLFLSLVLFVAFSCKNEQKTETVEEITVFGEDFDANDVVGFNDMLTKLNGSTEPMDFVVKGKVDGVCQAKGCWMSIVPENGDESESMFVKFHDYGFFVPKDLSGNVIMKGQAYYEETSVDELKHYAEDEGKSAKEIEAITEPVRELKFMATGVKVD